MSYVDKQGNIVPSFQHHNGFIIYPITHNLIDLFWGKGFTNQARFKLTKEGWSLWSKTSNPPRGYQESLQAYQAIRYSRAIGDEGIRLEKG